MQQSLEYFLAQVPDHRRKQAMLHQKVPLLVMMVLANMSGCYGYREMANFMDDNIEAFKQMYELKHGVPQHVSLRTFILQLNFPELLKAFRSWADQYVEYKEGEFYSFDGKGMNSTVENCHDSAQNYKSMVSIFCQKTGMVVNTELIELKKSHEIGAVQFMLGQLKAKGIILTGDALHCQKKRQQ
jgi:hypothetical protein